MVVSRWRRGVLGGLALGAGWCSAGATSPAQSVTDGPPALEAPVGGDELMPAPETLPARPARGADAPLHEAFLPPKTVPVRVRAPQAPPNPIAERPSANRPGPLASWIPGYWAWSQSGEGFVWVSGTWRVPPRDREWVSGRWVRDAEGWSREPGAWKPRQIAASDTDPTRPGAGVGSVRPAWKTTGPPTEPPAEAPGHAPDPESFYVPGHYTPDGDRVSWTPGFWTAAQPGWDWVPARWVRRPDGWDYRAGSWVRDPVSVGPRRYTVARPAAGDGVSDLPPAIVESEPGQGSNPLKLNSPPTRRDLVAENEDTGPAQDRTQAAAGNPASGAVDPRLEPSPTPNAAPGAYPMNRPPGPYPPGSIPRPNVYGRPNRRGGLLPPIGRRLFGRYRP